MSALFCRLLMSVEWESNLWVLRRLINIEKQQIVALCVVNMGSGRPQSLIQ